MQWPSTSWCELWTHRLHVFWINAEFLRSWLFYSWAACNSNYNWDWASKAQNYKGVRIQQSTILVVSLADVWNNVLWLRLLWLCRKVEGVRSFMVGEITPPWARQRTRLHGFKLPPKGLRSKCDTSPISRLIIREFTSKSRYNYREISKIHLLG